MHIDTPFQLLSLAEICKLLCKSRSGLYKLMAADTTFPRPIKDGTARQARVVFVSSELAAWQQSKLTARERALSSPDPTENVALGSSGHTMNTNSSTSIDQA